MTAPEPTPTVEHVDAVALPSVRHIQAVGRVLWETSRADEGTMSAIGADLAATAILTSTDPAVHAAMLDALVRAGVLTERFAIRDEGGSVWLDAHGDHREAKPGGMEFADRSDAEGIVARPHEEVMRRLVTPWEVAP